ELAVAQVVLPGRGVDPDDPEPAEVALLAAAADVGEVAGPLDRLLGRPVELPLGEEVALRQPQYLLAALPPLVSSLDPRPVRLPSQRRRHHWPARRAFRRRLCPGSSTAPLTLLPQRAQRYAGDSALLCVLCGKSVSPAASGAPPARRPRPRASA